jgi:hypothetical protein
MSFPFTLRTARSLESAVMALLPHGGQGAARRNAWSAMSADATMSRTRREADLAMNRAIARSAHPSAATS